MVTTLKWFTSHVALFHELCLLKCFIRSDIFYVFLHDDLTPTHLDMLQIETAKFRIENYLRYMYIKTVPVLTISDNEAYLTFKSISIRFFDLFKFDCQLMLKSVP